MKLTQEEQSRIDNLHKNHERGLMLAYEDIVFLFNCFNKLNLRPESRERFTYELRSCVNCAGSGMATNNISALMRGDIRCKECAGLGKVRVKVKSKAHNA